MQKGDIIYKVKDISAAEAELDILVQEYTVVRKAPMWMLLFCGGSEEIPLHIQRRMVEVATVEHQMLPDKTGYVEVTQFDTVTLSSLFQQCLIWKSRVWSAWSSTAR